MALIVKDAGGGFEPLEAGTYVARCITVVDLGIQQTHFGGKEKVYIGFEVPEVRVQWKDDSGKDMEGPARIGSRYTLSINPKSILGQHLTSWRGRPFTDEERAGFDLFNVLGVPAMISVTHASKDNKTYANITAIMRLPKGMQCPPAESELVGYTPSDAARIGAFDKLPEWLQKLCTEGHGKAAQSLGNEPRVAPVGEEPPGYYDDYDDSSVPF